MQWVIVSERTETSAVRKLPLGAAALEYASGVELGSEYSVSRRAAFSSSVTLKYIMVHQFRTVLSPVVPEVCTTRDSTGDTLITCLDLESGEQGPRYINGVQENIGVRKV